LGSLALALATPNREAGWNHPEKTENSLSFFALFALSVVELFFNDNSPQGSQGTQRRPPTGTDNSACIKMSSERHLRTPHDI
jgi:hypothetical protein